MNDFEKYLEIKRTYKGFVNDDILIQYRTIVQVMSTEKENFEKHRKELKQWLANIEKTMKKQKEEFFEKDWGADNG